MNPRRWKMVLTFILCASLVGATLVLVRGTDRQSRIHLTAYFVNSNGLYVGDEVRILGLPVGKIDRIEPQPEQAKVSFWVDGRYKVPADVNAAVISPSLVSVRAIQLTPAYTSGPTITDDSSIPLQHTAVPIEWDDLRQQLLRLTDTLQPTQPGGLSTLGRFVSTSANNLRGQGANIRDTLIKVSQAFSALGDHSQDLFGTIKNISILVSALQSSTDLLRQLNQNLAGVTGLLSNGPDEVGAAVQDINDVIGDVQSFVADNKETIGTTSDKLASVTTALNQSLDDIKQTLHITPTAFSNFVNIYQPAQGAFTGAIALGNFSNPISFLCGAIQAASRLGAEQSAKLCVQYLAPIIKNRQINFPPLGENLFVGASARPNEITYSEDWLRPDYVPPPAPNGVPDTSAASPPPSGAPLAAEAPLAAPTPGAGEPPPVPNESVPTDPANGLQGLMVPPGAGS
jgi:phospholipid/cholesterol/gamma-HCH transport system substrate-binding protein